MCLLPQTKSVKKAWLKMWNKHRNSITKVTHSYPAAASVLMRVPSLNCSICLNIIRFHQILSSISFGLPLKGPCSKDDHTAFLLPCPLFIHSRLTLPPHLPSCFNLISFVTYGFTMICKTLKIGRPFLWTNPPHLCLFS